MANGDGTGAWIDRYGWKIIGILVVSLVSIAMYIHQCDNSRIGKELEKKVDIAVYDVDKAYVKEKIDKIDERTIRIFKILSGRNNHE